MNIDYQLIQLMFPIAGAIVTFGGAFHTIQKVRKSIREEKDAEMSKILREAKEEMALVRAELESKINETKIQLKNLEFNIGKDIDHIKEAHAQEIRILSDKIQSLRDELREQHVGILQLLNKLIDKN